MIKKNFNLEKLRVVAAVMVIILHASYYIEINKLDTFWNYRFYKTISDWGVIFFFMLTGYLTAQSSDPAKIKKSIKKTIILYIIAVVSIFTYYSLTNLIRWIYLDVSFINLTKNLLRSITLTKFVTGTMFSGVTWYFVATIISQTFIYYFIKHDFELQTIVLIPIIMWLITLFNIIDISVLLPNGGFVKALLCMSFGYYSYYINSEIKHSNILAILIILSGPFVATGFNQFILIIYIFSGVLTLNYCKYNLGKETPFSQLGSRTLPVYIYHQFFVGLFGVIFEIYSIDQLQYNLIKTILCISLSFIFAPSMFDIFSKVLNKIHNVFLPKNLVGIHQTTN